MRPIDADALKRLVNEEWFDCQEKSVFFDEIDRTPTSDAVPVVRCKDCKHRPTKIEKGARYHLSSLVFPDDKCPCECDDPWYNWEPADDWFCANGERNEE